MSARCGSCTSTSVTRISITMADGDVVDFTSCHKCEHKSYVIGDQPVELSRVMALAGKKK